MKKWIAILLSMTLLLGLSLPTALAAGEPTVTLSSGQVKAGESVTLKVSIRDNPGLANCMLYFYYDTSVFTVNTRSGVKAAADFAMDGSLIVNTIETAKANGRYTGAAGKDGVLALWYNSSGIDTAEDGTMMTVTLTAAANAVNGTYTVGLGYSMIDTANEDGNRVALNTVAGTITVSGGAEGAVPPAADEPVAFSDVAGHWAEAEILQSAELGLVNGYPDGTYAPDNTMTRAECVTILWRASGSPKPKAASTFTDLDPIQQWYWDAVAWAEENCVINGVGDGKFDPTGNVTREQLVTILHRMAGTPVGAELMFGAQYDANHPDSDRISGWAKGAVHWSIYKGIYCGENSLDVGVELKPTAYATRAQIAVMMVRYLDKY